MTTSIDQRFHWFRFALLTGLLLALIAALFSTMRRGRPQTTNPALVDALEPAAPEANVVEVQQTCGGCHVVPPPDSFGKFDWPHEIARGLRFLSQSEIKTEAPSFAKLVAFYQHRAPDTLSVLSQTDPASRCPVRFEKIGYRSGDAPPPPVVANVRFVHFTDDRKLDVVACDMVRGRVLLVRPYDSKATVRVLSDAIPNPAHAELIDLDRDGIKDLIVANLGSPAPTDQLVGSVVWLKGTTSGDFKPVTLASGLGRVSDVQAADFDGDGDLDLIVAEFGWLESGAISLLENRTAEKAGFVRTVVDPRHGGIHVPVTDLNGDGRPDFIALISQEHEKVVAYLNQGKGRFSPQEIYAAPHPAFGSSGIQVVDLDGDGDLDVLLTNGDSLDSRKLRPYHGVQWLENRGAYPYFAHPLTALHGVHRAVAGDVDGDGDLDIVAVSFLPGEHYRDLCRQHKLDSIVLLEQVAPGKFDRRSLETITCDHLTCDLGDFDGDGKLDLVTANGYFADGPPSAKGASRHDSVVIWKNRGKLEPIGAKPEK